MSRQAALGLGLLVVLAVAAGRWLPSGVPGAAARPPAVTVIASGLNQPKKLTLAPSGDLIVTLSGDGAAPSICANGNQLSCLDRSGAVDEIGTQGGKRVLISSLSSVSSGGDDPQATGPIEARLLGHRLEVLFQDLDLKSSSGVSTFGAASLLGDLVSFGPARGSAVARARLGPYEARHTPDRGAGTAVTDGWEGKVNSDPYSFVPYRGGYVVADAGANDLLFVSRTGRITVLAVLPTIRERAPAGTFGSTQKTAIEAQAQAVPTAVAVGPDGALYVGELGGAPFDPGTSTVYRVEPGHRATVYAGGFTAIGDIAFDAAGRLLVLEIDRNGLDDPGINKGAPASGAIIRVARDGDRHTLVSSGLHFPTGLVVGRNGDLYVSDFGVTSAASGHGGEIVRVDLSAAS